MAEVQTAADADQPLLVAEGLAKNYGRLAACRDVSFALYPGEVLAIGIPIVWMIATAPHQPWTRIEVVAIVLCIALPFLSEKLRCSWPSFAGEMS